MANEVGKALNDPSYALNIAVGPPFPELVPQQPGSGLTIGKQVVAGEPRRFILKKAHMSNEDFRIFDATQTKRVVAVMHHYGKNPYGSLDPLGVSHSVQVHENRNGEWESLCDITGYCGMPSLRIRPKSLSMHGRQLVQSRDGSTTYFNIGKESRLKEMSIRPNMAVSKGEDKDEVVYRVQPDLLGRTFQVVNERDELVCFVQKSTKALILEAAMGSGSEMLIDVAPGVDWTVMLAVLLSIYQVGEHWAKDALGNFVINPLQDSVIGGTLQATGLDGVANAAGKQMDEGMKLLRKVQDLHRMFK